MIKEIYGITLPKNKQWDEGGCPVERLEVLREALPQLENNVFSIIRKPEASSDDLVKISREIRDMNDVLQSTAPDFPYYPRWHWSCDNKWNDEYEITPRWKSMVNKIGEIEERVTRSLNTPGPSTEEKEGWWIFKETVDEKVKRNFTEMKKDLDYLLCKAYRIRETGLTDELGATT